MLYVAFSHYFKEIIMFCDIFSLSQSPFLWIFITFAKEFKSLNMGHKDLNRLKQVLVEKNWNLACRAVRCVLRNRVKVVQQYNSTYTSNN